MKVLSLFDGISCGQVALQKAGIETSIYYASEINQHAIKVALKNYPKTQQLGCVKKVVEMVQSNQLKDIDLLIGGSPCQGFSRAGFGQGFVDPRSALFFDFVIIKNTLKPKWFLLENVKMKKIDQDIISAWLGVQPIEIDSALFSAQSRKRLYWTNIPIKEIVDQNIKLNDILEKGWVSDRNKSYCITANYYKGSNFRQYFHKSVKQIVFKDGKIPNKPDLEFCSFLQKLLRNDWRNISVIECERLQTLPDGYTNGISKRHQYEAIGNGWTVDVIAHIFKGIKL